MVKILQHVCVQCFISFVGIEPIRKNALHEYHILFTIMTVCSRRSRTAQSGYSATSDRAKPLHPSAASHRSPYTTTDR